MKYIIFDNVNGAFDCPIIFIDAIPHHVIGNAHRGEANILSAGFVQFRDKTSPKDDPRVELCTYGKSTDYPNKPPRPEDDKLLTRAVREH